MAPAGSLGTGSRDEAAQVVAALRAMDWRFLLPVRPTTHFRHLVLLGGPPGAVTRARRTGVAHEVTDELPAASTADAVVAYADARHPIDAIAAAVAPDGVLYLEIDRTTRGVRATTPGRVDAMLQALGFGAAAMYAAEPTLTEARAFIPLDVPRAMTWHRRMNGATSASQRLAAMVRHSVTRIGGRSAAALDRPYVVVAARDGASSPTPWALAHEPLARLAGWRETPAGTVMLTYGGDRVIFFPFAHDADEPVAVVKVTKADTLAERTEHEQACMRALREMIDPSLATAIPEPFGVVPIEGCLIACEQYLPGVPLASRARDASLSLEEKTADLQSAMTWLARFHRATEVRRLAVGELAESLVPELLDTYRTRIGLTPDETTLFERLRMTLDTLGAVHLPVVRQHRDFAAWNVLRHDAAVHVLDWEGAREEPAFSDAIHLATTWLFSLRFDHGGMEAQCVLDIASTTAMPDDGARAAREAVGAYLDAVQIDRRLLGPLVVLHRVELAVRRAIQRDLHGGGSPDTQIGGASADVEVVRALARDAAALLPTGSVSS